MKNNNPNLWLVPLEALTERYTGSWYKNVPPAFSKALPRFNVKVIEGIPLSNTIGVGTFLDINSTIHFKNAQLQNIAKLFHEGKVRNNDVFFFSDIEFWGIESVRLMASMNKVKVYLTGFLHAGSYTKEDAFEIASPYQRYTEVGWIAALDRVYVGSQYHKKAFTERRLVPVGREDLESRIMVSGNPLFRSDYPKINCARKDKIILPNRFDWEKRPNLSLNFAYILKRMNPYVEIAVTTSSPSLRSNRDWLLSYARLLEHDGLITIYENQTKEQYHRHLAESKVMLTNSIEENFGYCIVESLVHGTPVVAPDAYSHTELLRGDDLMLFSSDDQVVGMLSYFLDNYDADLGRTCKSYAEPYFKAINTITQDIDTLKFTTLRPRSGPKVFRG